MIEEEYVEEKGIEAKEGSPSKALLVGVYSRTSLKPVCEEHLAELEELANTFGVETIGKVPCSIRKVDAATFLQEGKLAELREQLEKNRANLLIFDEEISPAQQRNLEKFLKVPVMDRAELILEIFAQRAQTKEARLQVELAKTKYEFPRLKRLWSHFSRQSSSGGGFLKGEGEKQLEIDKRLLNKKLQKLTEEIQEVKKYRQTQAAQRRRSGIPTFAIIGYTNAGKSTLLHALTQADVLIEDKLFATLDPTTRKFMLPNNQEVLLSDTVGFIRKLPHTLVAAFRSTLEATLHDDILIHLIDVSHPMAEEQADTTYKLLQELNIDQENVLTALNKIDQCTDQSMISRFRIKYSKTVPISAKTGEGLDELGDMMVKELSKRRKTIRVKIPQSEYALVSILHREGNVIFEEYEEDCVLIHADVPITLLYRFELYLDD